MVARTHEIRMSLLAARQRCGSWAATADEVACAISEIGRRWELGLCAVFEEHGASEALRRAAAACAEDIPREKDAARAALFTVAEERHTLGLSLAELVLAEAGLSVAWLGEGPPADELPSIVQKQKPDLLIVSASAACRPQAIATYQRALIAATAGTRTMIILGGAGSWVHHRQVSRAVTFVDLRRIVDRRKPALSRSA
jgi:methanogenic corrinoid protein MtbC1